MKELSVFIRDAFVSADVNGLFEDSVYICAIDDVDSIVSDISCGKYVNVVCKNSSIKEYFIDSLYTLRPDANVINCNCSVNRFFENEFNGLLIFNNMKNCKHTEIIEEISNHKGIRIL